MWYQHIKELPCAPKDVQLLEIPIDVKSLLLRGEQPPDMFKQQIDDVLDGGQEYFIRLSSTSGKNETPVRPFSNSFEIIEHLKRCKLFRSREYERDKPTYLILIPWNSMIDARNEFRIFVCDGVLCCASPQYWWETHNYSSDELDIIQFVLADSTNFEFMKQLPFNTFIADVYIDMDTSSFRIIELNPFGAHCGAGSSLFNWIDDYRLLHGLNDESELRYLSIVDI